MPLGYERELLLKLKQKMTLHFSSITNSMVVKQNVLKYVPFSSCRSNILSCTQGLMSGPTQGPPIVGWGCIWAWWSLRKAAEYGVPKRIGMVAILGDSFTVLGERGLLAWFFFGFFFPSFLKTEEGMGLHIVKKKKRETVLMTRMCNIFQETNNFHSDSWYKLIETNLLFSAMAWK